MLAHGDEAPTRRLHHGVDPYTCRLRGAIRRKIDVAKLRIGVWEEDPIFGPRGRYAASCNKRPMRYVGPVQDGRTLPTVEERRKAGFLAYNSSPPAERPTRDASSTAIGRRAPSRRSLQAWGMSAWRRRLSAPCST